jgi:hypothetical protein
LLKKERNKSILAGVRAKLVFAEYLPEQQPSSTHLGTPEKQIVELRGTNLSSCGF